MERGEIMGFTFASLLSPGWWSGFLSLLLQASFFGNWLVLALLLLQRLRMRPASLFCALAALFRLLLPVPIQSPLSLHRLWMDMQQRAVTVVELSDGRSAAVAGAAFSDGAVPTLFLMLWALGAMGTLAVFVVRFYRQRRMLCVCMRLPASSPAVQAVWAAGRGCGIPVYSCENVSAPLAAGIFRPRIVIPAGLAFTGELHLALMHEREHIRCGHNLLKAFMLLACCLHWWNPLCWQLQRALCEELELCCDRRALGRLGAGARAPYARALLHFYAQEPAPAFSSAFSGGAAEERIRQIMTYRPRRGRTFSACILTVLLFSLLASLPAASVVSVMVQSVEASDAGEIQEDGDMAFQGGGSAAFAWEAQVQPAVDGTGLYSIYVTQGTVVEDTADRIGGTAIPALLKFFFFSDSRASSNVTEEIVCEAQDA